MPIKGGKYAMKKLKNGTEMRLHFNASGKVDEVKNMKTGKKHTKAEFAEDRKKAAKKKKK